MKLRTKKIEQWIVIDGVNPGERAEFLVHPLSPKEISDLLERTRKTEWERGQRFVEPEYFLFKIQKIFATILDWKGIENEDGAELPCTDKNKQFAYLYNSDLIDKVIEKADALYKTFQDEEEKEAKN